jgi:hypothetical protein
MSDEKADFHLVDEQPSSKKDWEISDLYSKAWQIVKKHKITWIFGAAVAATAAGSSSNFRSSNSVDSESIQKLFGGMPKEATSSAEMSKVLGESINPFQQLFTEIGHRIPTHYYFILGAEILFLLVIGILITIIYRAWAHASLIESVYSAYKYDKTSISEASQKSFKHLKSFIWLDIIPGLVLAVGFIIYVIALILAFSIGDLTIKIIAGILGLIGLIFLIYLTIILSIGLIWAYREVIVSGKNARIAFWNGIKIARKKRGASILLGFLNGLLATIAAVVPTLLIIGVIAAGVISYITTKTVSPFIIGAGVLAIVIVMPILVLIGAITQAFKATIWTIAYDKIKGKYTDES